MADENGPKGGIDKTCVVNQTDQHSELVVKDIQADLYVAVGRVLVRATVVGSYIKRSRDSIESKAVLRENKAERVDEYGDRALLQNDMMVN